MKSIASVFESLIEGLLAVVVLALILAFIASPLIFLAWLTWLMSK